MIWYVLLSFIKKLKFLHNSSSATASLHNLNDAIIFWQFWWEDVDKNDPFVICSLKKKEKGAMELPVSISINSSVYQNKNSICFLPEKYYATISQAVKIYWRGLVGSQKNMAQNFHESSLFRYFAKWRQIDKDTGIYHSLKTISTNIWKGEFLRRIGKTFVKTITLVKRKLALTKGRN